MIKQLFNKLFLSVMALLIVFSTASYAVEKHYCGDVLVDVTVFIEAENCDTKPITILQKETCCSQEKTCCKSEIELIKGQEELYVSSFEDFNFEFQQMQAVLAVSHIQGLESLPKQNSLHKHYSPPKLVANIYLLDQVFII
ncbi:hypothetical protein GSB9_01429 [Flavobacteriaceae bacterium GSB9]|nr:hypothetical protein GSB9_01429 [Flavobacteriaceae bacterium GSB9]